jgi:hypothetical protein
MRNDLTMFATMSPVSIPIATGNKGDQQELKAVGTGTAVIQLANGETIRLCNTLYLPNLARNLISLVQLIKKTAVIHPTAVGFAITLDKKTTIKVNTSNLIFEMSNV